jgi:hypothetical protein
MPLEFNEGGYAWEGVETVLRRRGHVIAKRGDPAKALFDQHKFTHAAIAYEHAHGVTEAHRVVGRRVHERYTEMYGRTELRRMLPLLLASPDRAIGKSELERVAGRRCEQDLEYLTAVEVVAVEADQVRLLSQITDLGPSLEQYIRMICNTELRGHAEWSISLEEVGSGDFDVIAWLPPTLVYVEYKATTPNNVEANALRQMLLRTRDLGPDLTILVIDTDYDIASIVGKISRSETNKIGVHLSPLLNVKGIYQGLFRHWPIYAMNAKPSILTQIRRCLRHYHSYGKWRELESVGVWSPKP